MDNKEIQTSSDNNVTLHLVDGPVEIRSLAGAGLSKSYVMWGGVIGHEEYPANVTSANYNLQLTKAVESYEQVKQVEAELFAVLQLLAEAWIFAGGTVLFLHVEANTFDKRVISNADEVEKRLLEKQGLSRVSSDMSINYSIVGSYHNPPLREAIEIASYCRKNEKVRNVLRYYYKAKLKDKDWYSSLYKVKDALIDVFHKESITRRIVDQNEYWGTFEDILNNHNLRHPGKKTKSMELSKDDETRIFSIAHQWIVNALMYLGIMLEVEANKTMCAKLGEGPGGFESGYLSR